MGSHGDSYDYVEDGTYCYPGTSVPRNRLGIRDASILRSVERARGERRRVWGHDPVDPESLERAIGLYMARSATVDEIVSLTGLSKSTLYREIARRGLKRD